MKSINKLPIVVFLGPLGIHKFLEKKYLIGILYLFTVGLFCIGWFVDIIICIKNVIEESKNNKLNSNIKVDNVDKNEIMIDSAGFYPKYIVRNDSFIVKDRIYYFDDIKQLKYNDPKASRKINSSFIIMINGQNITLGWPKKQYDVVEKVVNKIQENITKKDLVKKEKEETDKREKYNSKINSYKESLKNIPNYEITLNSKATRNPLITMEEIKVSSINKNFNKDSLVKHIVISINTTGLDAINNDIIEISAIKYVDYKPIQIFNTYIKPRNEVSEKWCIENGYDYKTIINSPSIKNVIPDFDEFAKGFSLISYNIHFVMKFLYVNGTTLLENNKVKKYNVSQIYMKSMNEKEQDSLKDAFFDFNKLLLDDSALSKCIMTENVFENSIERILYDYE